MNKKKEREERNERLAAAIEDQIPQDNKKYPMTKNESIPPVIKTGKTYEEIAAIRRIEIPKCDLEPINGRIYVIEAAGGETVTESGIILAHKLNIKKDDRSQDAKRYFVIAWDKDDIPPSISKKLFVGIEVNPFLPQEAEEWSLPKVIDWSTGNVFLSIHYTELAGVSKVKPIKAE